MYSGHRQAGGTLVGSKERSVDVLAPLSVLEAELQQEEIEEEGEGEGDRIEIEIEVIEVGGVDTCCTKNPEDVKEKEEKGKKKKSKKLYCLEGGSAFKEIEPTTTFLRAGLRPPAVNLYYF